MNRVNNIRAMKTKLVLAARNVFRLVGTKFQIRLYCRDKFKVIYLLEREKLTFLT